MLRNRNFLFLWAAYSISAFGDHLADLGLMRVLRIEHSTRQVQTQALMTFLFFLPAFAIGWLAGTLADRLPRRAVMIGADLIRAAILLALPFWLAAQVRTTGANLQLDDLLVALAPLLLLGLFSELFSPARSALLPQLVRDDQLVRANSISSGMGTIAAMLSNMVGGVLAEIDPIINFLADAGTFIASALFVIGIRLPGARRAPGKPTGDSAVPPRPHHEPFSRMIAEGLRYVRTHHRVMELIILATFFWTGAAVFTSVLPSVVFDRYHLGYDWVGWMRGALAGGMLLGAILLTALGDRIHGELVNFMAMLGAGAALIGFAWVSSVAAGIVMAALVGIAGAALLISINTMLQRIVPNRARGRVFGITDVATMAGLLVATGLLGLWPIPGLDTYVPHILTILGIVIAMAGMIMHAIASRRTGLGSWFQLLWRLNHFYVRWWYRLERVNSYGAPRTGPAILAANHTTYIDPLLLYGTAPPRIIGFMVAQEYLDMPVLGRFLRSVQCIATTRSGHDLAATRQAIRRLQAGQLVGIFPQGHIQLPDQPSPPQEGIVLLALRSRARSSPYTSAAPTTTKPTPSGPSSTASGPGCATARRSTCQTSTTSR